ncbi:hypothetical protein [Variovorax sp. WS11]|uniref:hypothetical protein n=1 Tax=Variovorax sp. WS11 TaxID=1105204 RepID=UPI0013DB32F2|nr:hypothetical protein [Variovorax sp. WS11]NDZ18108.1 hypothetical protein [Variovorax sp. WS11]
MSLFNRLAWMREACAPQPGAKCAADPLPRFDVSVWEFFWPLMQGLCSPWQYRVTIEIQPA